MRIINIEVIEDVNMIEFIPQRKWVRREIGQRLNLWNIRFMVKSVCKGLTEAGSWRVGESTKDLSRAEGDQILRNKGGVSLVVSVKGIEGGRGEFRMDLAYRKSTCPSIHPYIYLSFPPITHPSIPHLSIHPIIHLSVHPSIHPTGLQLLCQE